MYTLFDYIKFYNARKIKDLKWNDADNLICSLLCYLPVESFKGSMTLNELYEYIPKHKEKSTRILVHDMALKLLKEIYTTERYKNIVVSNFVNERNNDVQFGAATFRMNNKTVIAFKGTDNSIIGWVENIRLFYTYPTLTQKRALEYLKTSVRKLGDNELYLVGHSKGGNMAMSSALDAPEYIFKKIQRVVNFDGPGFRYEQFDSKKYQKLKKKLVNYIPSGSIVGTLLENNNYSVVKSNALAWNQHYPETWEMYGEYFVNSKLSQLSSEIHERTTINVRHLNKKKIHDSFETLIAQISKEHKEDLKFSLEELYNLYKNLKQMDPEVGENFEIVIDALLKSAKEIKPKILKKKNK